MGTRWYFITIFFASSRDRRRAEEEAAVDVDIRRLRVPFLASDRVGVEDGPDRAAAVVAIADTGQRGVEKLLGSYLMFLRIEIAAGV